MAPQAEWRLVAPTIDDSGNPLTADGPVRSVVGPD